jgi:hypothetical protein
MSKSDDERRENKRAALCLMAEQLGDRHLSDYSVSQADSSFANVFPTTWRELLDDGLIDDKMSTFGGAAFRLTAHGWIRALMLSGEIDALELRTRSTRLAQALKAVVKGRNSHYDQFTSIDEIATSAGLPHGWVFNAIKSRLLGAVFPDDRWDAQLDQKSANHVRVSPTFGLNYLFDE